ncbi:ash family protein [Vibrio diazotrophicus]
MMINTMYATRSQGFGLPKFTLFRLTVIIEYVYSLFAAAKSVAGIGTPFIRKAHRRQLVIAGFFMRKICAHQSNSPGKLHSNYGGLDEAAERLAVSLRAVVPTLFSSPPVMRLVPLGGDSTSSQEAVIMTTTPTQAVTTAMIYTFIIAGGVRALSDFKRIRTISAVATSEARARKQLAGLPLVFVRQTPIKEGAL